MCDRTFKCPSCGDKLIHLRNRGPHESSSPLGQHLHDVYPRTFNVVDDDAEPRSIDVQKRTRSCVRRLEHKFPGQKLSTAQGTLLPVYAEAFGALVARGRLSDDSGVFVITCEIPPTSAEVERVWWTGQLRDKRELQGAQLDAFLTGEVAA